MMENSRGIHERIQEFLKRNPKGMTITELASSVDLNRNSMARYLDVLQVSGQVEMRRVGSAKMYFLSQRVPLEAMLDISDDGILTYDDNLTIITVNDGFAKLVGMDQVELLGYNLADILIPGLDSDHTVDWLREAAQGKGNSFETKIDNGALLSYVRAKLVPTTFDDSSTGGTVILEDITESKHHERELQQQRDYLRLVMESVTHPFYVIDAENYTIQMANRAARLGSLREDSTCHTLTHNSSSPCSGDVHPCPLKEVRETGRPVVVEHVHHHVSGKTRHVEIHAHPILDDKGNVTQVIEYNLDVTERKEIEEDLKQLLSMYQLIVEHMEEGLFVIQNETILFCNAPLADMLAYDVHEITGASASKVLSPTALSRIQSEDIQEDWQVIEMLGKNNKIDKVGAKIMISDYMGSQAMVVSVKRDSAQS
ncbi:MAG: PAS domain S-box protein [Candidatus Thorarchaeota archaeon]